MAKRQGTIREEFVKKKYAQFDKKFRKARDNMIFWDKQKTDLARELAFKFGVQVNGEKLSCEMRNAMQDEIEKEGKTIDRYKDENNRPWNLT